MELHAKSNGWHLEEETIERLHQLWYSLLIDVCAALTPVAPTSLMVSMAAAAIAMTATVSAITRTVTHAGA